ncbi:GNAT family N-acetyltransferase [Kitasatospora sp. GP82]|uniref:GNAT family N-acetyltransferase n=1 Tax=Kitasatospora sp. GP82 TaxID=3035089 RepID=UPI002473EF24|nr:GNAT family N-acetyltransferase [Kitasatospora sp. GP82]MDH6125607.1 putative GNAT family acetyltransferase [Kitasatospora sp. GP82]
MTESLTVTDSAADSRFEAWIGVEAAGFAEYLRSGELMVYPHTVVESAFEGQSVGSALARAALDDARKRGLPVLATRPFIKGWMLRHPEYADLAYENRSQVTD